ncbi:hypothetical protein EYF80_001784 [Liparis tanakae]|uniref:Uncharacterized protein n=1 Tax=Liparis tanakae TaxID=230148 RepID=A0A4Z2JCD2_9TELE|nr:hypothetical protein EYF80_001784 [Liparis tanakae]
MAMVDETVFPGDAVRFLWPTIDLDSPGVGVDLCSIRPLQFCPGKRRGPAGQVISSNKYNKDPPVLDGGSLFPALEKELPDWEDW